MSHTQSCLRSNNACFRITNKWIRGKPQEMSFPCKRKNNGFTRLPPLNTIYCDQNKNEDKEDCNEDRWSRDREIFFIPQLHYDSIKSINNMWYKTYQCILCLSCSCLEPLPTKHESEPKYFNEINIRWVWKINANFLSYRSEEKRHISVTSTTSTLAPKEVPL